jgi:NSS family neurotransmitter:Na+ symporter
MLPLGGLLIAIFAGWVMKETQARKELAMQNFKLYLVWRALVRIFSPVAVIALFVYSIWATFAPEEEAQAAEAPAQEQVDAVTSDAPAQQDTAAPLPQEGGTKVPVEQESP